MTCYHPNDAYVSGYRESNGSKIIRFGKPQKPGQLTLQLPCGQCIGCRLDYSQMWAVRAMHEASLHEQSCMVTLTYDDEYLPHYGSLCPPHFTKFAKKLRYHFGPFRYLMAGEYGDSVGSRPHYHALLFGYRPDDLDLWFENEGVPTYLSQVLQQIWGMGFITVSDLTLESAAYVARYALKKVKLSKKSPGELHAHYERICPITGEIRQVQPEYSRMSNRPGIARDWYTKFNSDIFPYDTTIYKGRKIKTPRYYENLYRSTDEFAFQRLKEERRAKAIKHAENNTPERLRVRETVKRASMRNIQRRYENS